MDETAVRLATSWLEWLYGEAPYAGRIWIGGHANWRGAMFTNAGQAVEYAIGMDGLGIAEAGVYHRLTTVSEHAARRGVDEDSILLPAVMLDLDLRGPGHKADTYPETMDDLSSVLTLAGLPEPSAWVYSGGGAYPCWKLGPPHSLVVSEDAFHAGRGGLRIIQGAVRNAARMRGWKLDNTSDLARVYRMPGTHNRKAGEPILVTWKVASGQTYALGDLIDGVAREDAHGSADAHVAREVIDVTPYTPYTGSSLFAPSGRVEVWESERAAGVRTFTVAEAMAFVRPPLEALATASDGEINVRLNEAACALAHFGPEFWDAEAADRQLFAALACTAYDARTWQAEDTIASARRGMASDWRATLVHEVSAASSLFSQYAFDDGQSAALGGDVLDPVAALLAEMVSVEELAARPTPKFCVHGLLQMDSESWLIGAPGSKKSFVAFDIAARVARGEPWQGRRTNPCDVVMILAEGAGGAGKRGAAWIKTYGDVEGIHILPRPVQAADVAAWRVLIEACGRIGDAAAGQGRGLMVIVDTQARVTVGLDENSAKEMGLYVEAIRAMRVRTGGCVLSVHHTGRTGGDARGSSAIDGAQTTELKVESASGSLSGRLLTEKQKDMEPAGPVRLEFKSVFLGLDADGEPITSLVLLKEDEWREAEVSAEALATEQAKDTNPFTTRVVVDPWIRERTPARAEQWAMQALWDIAEDEGLTGPEVRRAVEEKSGKRIPDASWYEAWQRITNTTKEESAKRRWNDVVIPAGGRRWTVDRTVNPSLVEGPENGSETSH